jgi:ATP-binding cassette, subfamily B, multidrug efflux pump
MRHLRAVNKYFWKYRWRFLMGILFIVVSNYFGILAPQVTGYVVDLVEKRIVVNAGGAAHVSGARAVYDPMVHAFINAMEGAHSGFGTLVMLCGMVLLMLALLRGFFMFLMRQTIIVMSRHIEYDQKNEVYRHYQLLDTRFYKSHSTGDLMSRMAEDVSKVRMYTGPAVMYLVNLICVIGFSLFYMLRKDALLSLYVLSPLPILAFAIYYVNAIVNRRSEKIQAKLSELTTNAQESYSGIRVIKSFVQESTMFRFFAENSESYRQSAVGLATIEAIYFPAIGLLIGLSTLLTICMGGIYQIDHRITGGTIAEFVVYINMLTFPVSAIGWVANMIQRASASQKRLNEFLDTEPMIRNSEDAKRLVAKGSVRFDHVSFRYPDTGIQAIADFNLEIRAGEKIAVIGRTGSGKSTLAQLLLRMYDPDQGHILVEGQDIRHVQLDSLRGQIAYVPQDVFLFSDTITGNIRFGTPELPFERVQAAARAAAVSAEIESFPKAYDTLVGERGVTLSGGQKQRVSIARALSRDASILLLDDCLSAVDARTEKAILSNLHGAMGNRTAIIITHRIFTLFSFDRIIVMEDGRIIEEGRHEDLLALDGYYRELWEKQRSTDDQSS